ncbi:hypothetical protein RRG08_027421 [Elysia crispata]|uniref:Uncharacterized protein n=1 Tax=Elysia crispata TaxID=231223 RepID=A0AAE0YF38_9GAST|nr:hypothetical protein RRG08_027421 [Elysia crispata]
MLDLAWRMDVFFQPLDKRAWQQDRNRRPEVSPGKFVVEESATPQIDIALSSVISRELVIYRVNSTVTCLAEIAQF